MSDENTESPSSADPSTVTQRVKEIRDLMLSGQWKTGSTSYGLALRWGISEYTVRKHANEASRQIESAFEDKSDLRAKVYLLLERAIDCAEEARPTAPEKAARIGNTAALIWLNTPSTTSMPSMRRPCRYTPSPRITPISKRPESILARETAGSALA